MPDEITTLIVDDHEVVREGLRLSLSRAPHIRVVGEASDGASAVEMAERRKPDVVIMDVRMPGMDGLEATKLLTERVPESKVLIFTAYSERSLLGRGLESGAKGYILKEAPHQTLVRAIEKVAQGEGYVDPALMPAFLAGKDQTDMLTGARARDPPAARGRHVERRRRRAALHLAGDGEEPRAAHPHEARGRHTNARGRDRAARSHHRLTDDGLDRLIAAEQDERRRIALFLHDGPVQNLAGIALMLDAALHAVQTGKLDDAASVVDTALERQRATIRELRDLSFALEPVVLRDQGFGPALQALAEQLGTTNKIRVDLDVEAATGIGQTAQVAIYTIIRELLDQAVRRGPLSRISVSIHQTEDGGASHDDRRRRRAGAAAPLVRGDRGARQTAPRHDRGRCGRRRHADRGDAAAVRDPAVSSALDE